MINVEVERMIPLSELPAHIEKLNGRRPHVSVIYRWAQNGVAGVRLETAVCGGLRCTSAEAVRRFDLAIEQAKQQPRQPIATETAASKAHARAMAKLAN